MRALMGIVKNRHGSYEARKKVPKRLEEATATVLGVTKQRQSWLKKSLGTKDLREAKHQSKAGAHGVRQNSCARRGAAR
jgi:hypothetical protein